MDDQRIESLGINRGDGLRQAHANAKEPTCYLPKDVDGINDRKPLCSVKFGGVKEVGKHPPPDPLLMAYKAAADWAKMTGKMSLLANNGEKPDTNNHDDMSEEDYNVIPEMVFLDADSGGYFMPQEWKELAAGLGQSNGYQV
jgi:hypothetical protein